METPRDHNTRDTPQREAAAPAAHVSDVEIRRALDTEVFKSLSPVSLGLGILYAVFTVSHLLVLPVSIRYVMAGSAAVTSAAFLTFRFGFVRWIRSVQWSHAMAFGFVLLALANSLLHLHLSSEAHQSTNIMLLMIGTGYFFLSKKWLAVTLALTVGGWATVAVLSPPSPLWIHFCFALFASLVLTLLINTVRTRTLRRLQRIYLQEERSNRDLQRAILSVQRSEEQYRLLAENSTDLISRHSLDGVYTYASPACRALLGYEPEDLVGRSAYDFLHPEDLEHIVGAHEAIASQSATQTVAYRVLCKDGTYIWFETTSRIVREPNTGEAREIVAVSRDISERKAVERMKDEFVSTVSHELRTPLTSIMGSLGLMLGGLMDRVPDQLKKLLDIAHRNSERLANLMNDILDIEKIESGKMEFRFAAVPLMPLVDQALEANQSYAQRYGVRFVITNAVPSATVRADSERLMQVFDNLLSNAAKFSPPNGEVEVSITQRDDAFRVSVSDHGPGIAEEFRDRVFEKFTQADSSTTRQIGGTGLGLNIVKSIVEKHGGRVDFMTEENEGTTFYFDLPTAVSEEKGEPPLGVP